MEKKYRDFIQKNFLILDSSTQKPVPFILNPVQNKYYSMLLEDYPKMEGVREIVLKARQEGISSLVLALFTVDFLLSPYSISICISHRKDATELLFKKVRFYIDSFCEKMGYNKDTFLRTDNKGLLESNVNRAMFYVGTAGAKVGGRGGSATNILYSEAAFYQSTGKITAEEIILATSQQVPQGKGMIFIESTGNSTDDFYYGEWERAKRKESIYQPRFFSWQEFYSPEWMDKKKQEFPSELSFKREYPADEAEAFVSAGSPYFDNLKLKIMLDKKVLPIREGKLAPDGNLT